MCTVYETEGIDYYPSKLFLQLTPARLCRNLVFNYKFTLPNIVPHLFTVMSVLCFPGLMYFIYATQSPVVRDSHYDISILSL